MYLVMLRWYFSWIQSFLQFSYELGYRYFNFYTCPPFFVIAVPYRKQVQYEQHLPCKMWSPLIKKLYRDCLLFAIIWQLKDVRNMLNLY